MGSFMYLSTLISLQILLSCFHLLVSMQPPCDDNDRANLLEFKQSFLVDKHVSEDPSAYPKVASWKQGGEAVIAAHGMVLSVKETLVM